MANTFKLKTKASVGTSLEEYYDVPSSKTAIILSISLSNKTGSAVTADVQVISDTSDHSDIANASANSDVYLIKSAPLPAGSTLEIMQGNKLVLQTTDVLQAKASVATSVDVIISLMEMDV